jgi:hypothetical protein
LGAGALSAGAATAALARPVAVAAAAGPAASCSAAAPVLLLTGDLAGPAAGGPAGACPGGVLVVRRAGTAGPVVSLAMGGRRYLVPLAALGYLGRGLDLGLFDVGALAAAESGGRLPVRVASSHGVASLPGVTVTSRRPGLALGYLTPAGAREFGAALLRQFLADHARGSYGRDGMFAGGVSLSLAGGTAAPLAPAPSFPMTTLTVDGTGLAGQPDTGDVMFVVNADNTARFVGFNAFDAGVTKFSVPLGHYWGFGLFAHVDPKAKTLSLRVAVLPRFTADRGGSTVHVAERAATSKVQIVTARPAEVDFTAVSLIHSETAGPPADAGFFEFPTDVSGHSAVPSLYLSPTGGLAPKLLTTVTSQRLSSPPGPSGSVPYVYSLGYVHRGGIGPQRFVARPGSLATVSTRFFAAPAGPGIGAQFELLLDTPESGLGPRLFIGYAFFAPARQISYFSTGPSMAWYQEYDQGLPNDNDQSEVRAFRPGQRLTENWGAYPLHPGPDVRLPGAGPGGPVVPSATRASDTLRLDWPAFSDNDPGHTGGSVFDPGTVISYRIDQNGKQVAAGRKTFRGSGSVVGTLTATANLAAARSLIRFTLDTAQPARSHPLSPVTHTVWTWRSAHESGSALPAGWICVPQTEPPGPPDRSCSVEPMMTLRYAVKGLALNGSAPAGQQALTVDPGHLQLAKASPVTRASVAVSFDGGKTWHPVRLTGPDGSFTAMFTAPAGATVSLRTSAADAAGGSITQTIINAYQVAS